MEKRIPTWLALLLLIGIIGSVIIVFERTTRIPSSAQVGAQPKEVTFTNISDTAFTVSWVTSGPATGAVTVSAPKQKSQTAFDDRDTTGRLGTYLTHSATIQNLQANTEYLVKILSNGRTYENNGSPFRVQTGPLIRGSPGGLAPAYGTVVTGRNEPAEGALVYLSVEGGQLHSTLVSKSGSFLIPLNLTRATQLNRFVEAKERLDETIRILYNGEESTVTTDTLNDSPVPTITVGKSYDFRKQQATSPQSSALAQSPLPQGTPAVLGEETQRETSVTRAIALTAPAQGAFLSTNLPLIQGTGVPGKTVGVVIGITNPVGGTAVVGGDGTWYLTPPKPLSEGRQSVTVTTSDSAGKPIAITHTFTILKSGTQVLGIATPSATPEATPTATLAGQPVPTSGNTLPTLLLMIFGAGILASGAVLFIK